MLTVIEHANKELGFYVEFVGNGEDEMPVM